MPRIAPVAEPNAKQQALFDAIKSQLGRVPNIFRTMAHSPALLEGYLGFSKGLSGGALSPADREAIALLLAGRNGCDYCAAAHTAIGKAGKIPAQELAKNLEGSSDDGARQALLDFAAEVARATGRVDDAALSRVRAAGYEDAQILEAVGHVALNLFTNAFNLVAGTEVDFPAVSLPARPEAA